MRKTVKLFGFGAAVLLLLLAAVPAVYGGQNLELVTRSEETQQDFYEGGIVEEVQQDFYDGGMIEGVPGDTVDFDGIEAILDYYQEDIDEIDQYVEDYIAEYGSIDDNFELSPYLQVKFDAIIEEINDLINDDEFEQDNQGQGLPLGGGVTKVDWEFVWIWFLPAWLIHIWLDDFWTIFIFETLGPVGLATIAILLIIASAGALASVAWVLASLLLGFGFSEILAINQGNGIIIHYVDFIIPGIPDFIADIEAQ